MYLLEYFYMALFCSFFSLFWILLVIIIVTPKPFYSHWLTTQDGHLLNCLRQGKTIKGENNKRGSIRCHSGLGPTFGGGYDIFIHKTARSNSNSYSNLGWTYSPPRGYSYGSTFAQTFLAGTYRFTPDEVETFYETT